MTTFNTNIELGAKAFVIRGSIDFYIEELTVGQVRVKRTLPKARYYDEPVYEEEYMCIETGVGSGNLWRYGKDIFKDRKDAERSVIEHQQAAYKQRAERDAWTAKVEKQKREQDLALLERLKVKYEVTQ